MKRVIQSLNWQGITTSGYQGLRTTFMKPHQQENQ
jgi:hypothetical protein